MYESPISIAEMTDDIIKKQNEQFENDLMFQLRASYHIDVDKDELIKALQYDRDQYNKGYQDGKADTQKVGQWIDDNCSECGQYVYHGDARNYCPNCGSYNGDEENGGH